jgi:UDP-N-acetylglucosamine 2-epimerase
VNRPLPVCPGRSPEVVLRAAAGARRVLVFARPGRPGVAHALALVAARLAERADVDVVVAARLSPSDCAALAVHENVSVRDRLGRDDLVAEFAASHLVVTDSGPVEEVAPALGVPVLVLAETIGRPLGLADGGALRCGADALRVLQDAERLLDDDELHRRIATAAPRVHGGRLAA